MQPDPEIWLDNHLSPTIAKWITDEFGIEAKSSLILQLSRLDDIDIFNKARAARNVVLITKDADFEPLVNRLGAPPKIINLTFGNSDNRAVRQKLKSKLLFSLDALFKLNIDFIQIDWTGSGFLSGESMVKNVVRFFLSSCQPLKPPAVLCDFAINPPEA